MRLAANLRIEPTDLPTASITGAGDIELNLDSRIGSQYTVVMIPPAQAEQIVNALVDALAVLKVPAK